MNRRLVLAVKVLSALSLVTACQPQEAPVNKDPLPSVAAPPYICDHIPLDAVRLMTGVQDPIVSGDFNLTVGKELDGKSYGSGACFVYKSTGNKPKVLQISLSPAGSEEEVEWEISQGARRLPEIVPGAVGYYGGDGADNTGAAAILVHGLDEVIVELIQGVKGRDNAADVVAMMKLVAPKLILDATTAKD